MFSFKSDSKDGVIIAKAEGPDIDCNISYFECDTKKPPTHVIDSYDACKILRDQYDSQFFHKNGKHKSSNEELLPIPGHIQVYGKNHLVLSPERVENQRHCIFLAGAPGSGKSYWVNDYAIRWQTLFPDGKIIVISRKSKEDEDNFKFTYQQSGVDE